MIRGKLFGAILTISVSITMVIGCNTSSQHENEQSSSFITEIQVDSSNRYYQKDGKPFFFIGYYDWAPPVLGQNITNNQTLKELIDIADRYGLNYIRVTLGINRNEKNHVPFKYVNGKFDLDQWEPGYWDGLKYHLNYAKDKGIYVHVGIFDGVNIRGGKGWWRYNNSYWNQDNQTKNFYGQIDANGNGNADEDGEFYQKASFDKDTGIGFYQKKLIDKAISELSSFDNVFYEIGNELSGSKTGWNEEVIRYVKARTNKVITNVDSNYGNTPANAEGMSTHKPDSSQPMKVWLEAHVGKGMPVWCDPDGGDLQSGRADDNRRAAWYSLTGGAAGYGGFQTDIREGGADTVKLGYYRLLLDFLSTTGAPFWTMKPQMLLVSINSENSLLAKEGEYYLAYIRNDSSATINLTAGNYKFKIYNPQNGNYSDENIINNWKGGNKTFTRFSGVDWIIYIYKM